MDNMYKRHGGPGYDAGQIPPDHCARPSPRDTLTSDALGGAKYTECRWWNQHQTQRTAQHFV